MEEIQNIIDQYKSIKISKELSSLESMKDFSTKFYSDVADIYDAITRVKNVERNPSGYNFNDAAILGLLIRIWKILKEVVHYYKENKGEIISLLDRQILESAIIAHYLLISGEDVIEDYRKCSYKDRLNIIVDSKRSPTFFKTPAGKRLKDSIMDKMKKEGLSVNSFDKQKKNKWKLSGKSFYQIFKKVADPSLYKYLYGIPSESIHGSWNESMDFNLIRNNNGTFSTYPHYQDVDMRFITPLLKVTNKPYLLWLKRIGVNLNYFENLFNWMNSVNKKLFFSFEQSYEN
ncbi:DUF5677 domain-containing protein [Candidatus Margulisiibacteriota bacterium]